MLILSEDKQKYAEMLCLNFTQCVCAGHMEHWTTQCVCAGHMEHWTLYIIYVLLKAMPPVCMKYTAQGESRVANIAQGEAECYICYETLTKCCIFHTNEAAVL